MPGAVDSLDVGLLFNDLFKGTGMELGVPASSLRMSMLLLGVKLTLVLPPPGPMLDPNRDDGLGMALCTSFTATPFLVSANLFSNALIRWNISPIIVFDAVG